MAYFIDIRCPTCDTIAYSFEFMVSHFGINTWKKDVFSQCKACHEEGLRYEKKDKFKRIETACDAATCKTRVYGLRAMREDFGLKPYPVDGAKFQEPHDLCRMCRSVGNPDAKEEEMVEGIYLDTYTTGGGRTPRSFVVGGPTAPYLELLKAIGGRWIKSLKDREGGGWVFPMRKKRMVISILQRRRNIFEEEKEQTEEEGGELIPEGACPKCGGETEDRSEYLICKKCNELSMK